MSATRSTLAVMTLAAGLLVLGTPAAEAGSHRPQMIKVQKERGGKKATKRTTTAQTDQTVRVDGTLHYVGGVLRLGKTPVQISADTVAQIDARAMDPRRLHGKNVTVFGVRTRRGLRADLVIFRDEGFHFGSTEIETETTPSASDSRVGTRDAGADG